MDPGMMEAIKRKLMEKGAGGAGDKYGPVMDPGGDMFYQPQVAENIGNQAGPQMGLEAMGEISPGEGEAPMDPSMMGAAGQMGDATAGPGILGLERMTGDSPPGLEPAPVGGYNDPHDNSLMGAFGAAYPGKKAGVPLLEDPPPDAPGAGEMGGAAGMAAGGNPMEGLFAAPSEAGGGGGGAWGGGEDPQQAMMLEAALRQRRGF